MLTVVIIILGTSFVLYTILGGADFGAGIIETLAGAKGEKTISKAIAPVWEANHVWLILAVVILFTGFPTVYSSLSLVLHIPLMLVLLGIIFRGTAFTFRHYDVVHDETHRYYTFLFKVSSIVTPFFFGCNARRDDTRANHPGPIGRILRDVYGALAQRILFPDGNFCGFSIRLYIGGIPGWRNEE